MSDKIELAAESRSDLGKGASRRLRRTGKIPAVVYGGGEPTSVLIEHKDLWKAQESEAFYSSVLNLVLDGKATDVVVKDLQRHPAKSLVLHADFQRIDAKQAITVSVPLHFINGDKCPGVKMQGGDVQITVTSLKIRCIPANLPEFIEVDLIDCEAGSIVHISDLSLAEGVESADLALGADHDLAIAQVKVAKGKKSDDDAEADDEGEAEAE